MKVSYRKELREYAKIGKLGLITIDYVTPGGTRFTSQMPASPEMLKHANKAMKQLWALRDTLPLESKVRRMGTFEHASRLEPAPDLPFRRVRRP